ncbi:cellulose binding domain-containing protein [Verrucosispora sp. WMMA2044]|uniref:Cellulose-binding protein n=2 Tax=Verrucosispora sioxanthis TaxID=2499994 RepID=A0A6M1KY31_9ACTN|nr:MULTISPECIES: cellulose binding domain-containing protein [Micromonospora]MCZ7421091.1 cellulose binding domain-containing protein [Verrucosispora sp. WMMA2121]NEE63302.1 cellulose-binding protein [Verrucosispora sioxanthis]NGM12412.1 cellulose-binding protein [Verrucosispora sioxanthis]WBB47793.1 cellulose binding domain-containing protein [Verrucosispora sp. WMMA2044]
MRLAHRRTVPPSRLRYGAIAATALVVASTAVVTGATGVSAAAGCRVDYTVTSQWSGGFGANVAITNLGDPLSSWTLTWSYGASQSITQAWNATVTQNGAAVTAKNVSYNGSIPTGGTTSFGFNGTWTSSNPLPTSFALNGVTCTGGITPTSPPTSTPTPTSSPSTPPPSGPADITVNTATKYQTVDGFGAATWIWGNSTWSTAETQTLVGMGPNQFGLSILRTGISPVSSEWSTHVNVLKTAESYGSNVKFLASPWTAPAAWKTNNSRTNGGKLRTDYYDDYASHLNSYVQYMRNQGVTIDVTSVQNEPDWHPDYDSMDWNGTELRNFVRDHGARVQNTKLMVAEAVNMNYTYTDPTLNDTAARNNIGYIGGHLYGLESQGRMRSYPLAEQHNKPVWMTEWNHHEADGSGSNIWGNPSNKAVWDETLDDIMRTVHRLMEANWNAYIWWYGKRFYSFIGDGESAYGTTAGAPLKRGYAFSQYSKYVRPGYQRVALTKSGKASPLEVTAYSGDGKVTLVILNRSNSAVNNAVIQAPQNVTKAEYTATSQNASAASQPASVNGNRVSVNVGARSISTVVLTL